MDLVVGYDMRIRALILWILTLTAFLIIWKLNVIETDVKDLSVIRDIIIMNKRQVELTHNQLVLLEQLYDKMASKGPTIYAITPTYARHVQKAELTRISQTLTLVPNVHWIVVEDSQVPTDLVTHLLNESHNVYTHLFAKTPPFAKLREKEPRWTKHRGVEQRNTGLKWLRDNLDPDKSKGIVYFMDDDNTYSVKLFTEIAKVKKVGVWPVGLVGGLNAELPIVDSKTGKVTGYKSGWKADRPFAIDMAGFAINLSLILAKPEANFSYKMEQGLQESEFLTYFVTKEELEPLADNCTKVYVWHTRTEKPKISGIVPGLEV